MFALPRTTAINRHCVMMNRLTPSRYTALNQQHKGQTSVHSLTCILKFILMNLWGRITMYYFVIITYYLCATVVYFIVNSYYIIQFSQILAYVNQHYRQRSVSIFCIHFSTAGIF